MIIKDPEQLERILRESEYFDEETIKAFLDICRKEGAVDLPQFNKKSDVEKNKYNVKIMTNPIYAGMFLGNKGENR